MARWHRPVAQPAPRDARGMVALVFEVLNTGEKLVVFPRDEAGTFDVPALERISHALRDQRRNNEHPIDTRLVSIVYRLQRHFHAGAIRVISGYRTPRPHSGSRHGQGRAIDLIVPGVSDRKVARYLRSLGYTGVGIYPTSGFVHLDVRARSYYWRDMSGPGQRNATRGILREQAKRSDRRAGSSPTQPWVAPHGDIERVWTNSQERTR